MPGITYECEDCGHQEERELRLSSEDDHEVIGGEVTSCPQCKSTDISEYPDKVSLRDPDREDFHADI